MERSKKGRADPAEREVKTRRYLQILFVLSRWVELGALLEGGVGGGGGVILGGREPGRVPGTCQRL